MRSSDPSNQLSPANRDFIPWDTNNEAVRQTTKSLVLQGLAHSHVGNQVVARSVVMEVLALPFSTSVHHQKNSEGSSPAIYTRSSIEAIRFASLSGTLPKALFEGAYMPHGLFKRKERVHVDTAYLHRLLASWNTKSNLDRLLVFASHYVEKPFFAFTLRFGEKMLESVKARPGQVFKTLKNRLVEVNKLGPVVFVVERAGVDDVHLHGLLAAQASDERTRSTLRHLGGKVVNPKFRHIQLVNKSGHHPIGWANYMLKELVDLPRGEQDRRIYISPNANQVGRLQLEALREACDEKLMITPELRGRACSSSSRPRDFAGRFQSSSAALH